MNPDEIAKLLLDIISEADDKFKAQSIRYSRKITNEIISLITGDNPLYRLETTNAGLIKQTAKNLKAVERIKRKLAIPNVQGAKLDYSSAKALRESILDLIDSGQILQDRVFFSGVGDFIGTMYQIERQNAKFFRGVYESFVPTADNLAILRNNAIERTVETMLSTGMNQSMRDPIKTILENAVTGKMSRIDIMSSLAKQVAGADDLTDFLRGVAYDPTKDRLPSFQSYITRYARDPLHQYTGAYQQAVTEQVGAEWYYYTPGRMEDTREFCRHRAGRYFHSSEVFEWPDFDWQGKIPTTTASNILILRGGYNCEHQIMPVSEFIVPKSDIKRVEEGRLCLSVKCR